MLQKNKKVVEKLFLHQKTTKKDYLQKVLDTIGWKIEPTEKISKETLYKHYRWTM